MGTEWLQDEAKVRVKALLGMGHWDGCFEKGEGFVN